MAEENSTYLEEEGFPEMTDEERARRTEVVETLKDSIDATLKLAGFIRRGQTWYRETDTHVHVVYLYRSWSSFRYRLHIGVQERAPESLKKEKRIKKYSEYREDSQTLKSVSNLLDFKNVDIDTAKLNIAKVVEAIEKEVLPYFETPLDEISVLTEETRIRLEELGNRQPDLPLTKEVKNERKRVHRQLVKKMDDVFGAAGFEREGLSWRRDMGDFIHVVSLIKMNLGRGRNCWKYAISVSALIKELAPNNQKPKDDECHYRGSFEGIAANGSEDRDWIEMDLDFDYQSKTIDEKIESLAQVLRDKILPFLEIFDSIDDIDVETFEKNTRIRRLLEEVQTGHGE